MYDVFIAHASEDKGIIIDLLYNHLRSHKLKVWYDKKNILCGNNIPRKIKEGLRNSSVLICASSS